MTPQDCPTTPRGPGRPRQFDEGEVLDRALEAFWRRGYESTSVTDLVAATGLQKGSLYKAFGDKHGLFVRALDRYLEAGIQRTREAIESAADPLVGITGWMQCVSQSCGAGGGHRGCLAVNAAVEMGPGDEGIRQRLELHFTRLENLIERAIVRGQDAGVIRAGLDPQAAAEHLVTVVSGLMASGRGVAPPDRTARVVERALAGLAPGDDQP